MKSFCSTQEGVAALRMVVVEVVVVVEWVQNNQTHRAAAVCAVVVVFCWRGLLLEFGQDRYREKSTDVSFKILYSL